MKYKSQQSQRRNSIWTGRVSNMKKLLSIILITLIGTQVIAKDFDKGLEAADNNDYITAYKEWKPLAEQGDARAQRNIGIFYNYGLGVEKNHAEALKWLNLSADQGNHGAQNELGNMSLVGLGVPEDVTKALGWYKLSAEGNNSQAQNSIGEMYREGNGVLKDYYEAIKWFRLSADQDDVKA